MNLDKQTYNIKYKYLGDNDIVNVGFGVCDKFNALAINFINSNNSICMVQNPN